jgi:hypothetical protein
MRALIDSVMHINSLAMHGMFEQQVTIYLKP